MRVLLVEDDRRLAEPLALALRRAGFEVTHAATAAAALDSPTPDIVLLDLSLPDRDGVEVCRQIRHRGETPIIILTARGDERDRVTGLRAGADDYVVKPFSLAELRARIDAVLRRARPRPDEVLRAGALEVDQSRHEVTLDGRPIALTPKEFCLLASLARHPGAVVSRDRLLLEVWHTAWRGNERTLDVHVNTLRTKLGDPHLVETIRGVGYRLAVRPTAPPPAVEAG
ncbi:MAG TPA: response regulator transcription factor [Pilimelia sp.]|nr:response regulator transcription factor [Pilimelia sp.]